MFTLTHAQVEKRGGSLLHCVHTVLLTAACGLLLLVATSESAAAGGLTDPCTLVTKAEAAILLGVPVKTVEQRATDKAGYENEYKNLSEKMEDKGKVPTTGEELWAAAMSNAIKEGMQEGMQEGREGMKEMKEAKTCVYTPIPSETPKDPEAALTGIKFLSIGLGQFSSRAEAARVFHKSIDDTKRELTAEADADFKVTLQRHTGIGDDAYSMDTPPVFWVLKGDLMLSISYFRLEGGGSIEPVKALAVKALSRLP